MPSIAGVDYRVDYCHLEVGISCQVYQVLIIGLTIDSWNIMLIIGLTIVSWNIMSGMPGVDYRVDY